jgi:hypothetical protein
MCAILLTNDNLTKSHFSLSRALDLKICMGAKEADVGFNSQLKAKICALSSALLLTHLTVSS